MFARTLPQNKQMESKLIYSKLALRDLDDIFDHIVYDLDNETAAMRIINEILEQADKLCSFPKMGAELSSIVAVPTDYRFLVCKDYLTFYHLSEQQVHIDRVLYGRSDYMHTLLQGQNKDSPQ